MTSLNVKVSFGSISVNLEIHWDWSKLQQFSFPGAHGWTVLLGTDAVKAESYCSCWPKTNIGLAFAGNMWKSYKHCFSLLHKVNILRKIIWDQNNIHNSVLNDLSNFWSAKNFEINPDYGHQRCSSGGPIQTFSFKTDSCDGKSESWLVVLP